MVTENIHFRDGSVKGEFAEYVAELQRNGINTPADVNVRSFRNLVYSSRSFVRFFPLRSCKVEQAEIAGQSFNTLWTDVSFFRCDFSHVRGVGHWSLLLFDNCKLVKLIGSYSVADCIFRKSNLDRCHLYQPVFIRCRFEKCTFKGAGLIEPTFVECEFSSIDLTSSRWEDCRSLGISGDWENGGELDDDSDPRAKEKFMGTSI